MTAIVRAAYGAVGDEVRVGFFSWHRIRRLPQDNPDVTGSFPHYFSEERSRRCHFSDPIGSSPMGLAVSLRRRPEWQDIRDLARYRIGTVKSYSNTPEFDRLVVAGKIRILSAATDEDNLRNLVAGKVDAAIIDRNVYAYLVSQESFRDDALQLSLDPRLLVVHKLYVCFPRTGKGKVARDHFNKGLLTLYAPMPPPSADPAAP